MKTKGKETLVEKHNHIMKKKRTKIFLRRRDSKESTVYIGRKNPQKP